MLLGPNPGSIPELIPGRVCVPTEGTPAIFGQFSGTNVQCEWGSSNTLWRSRYWIFGHFVIGGSTYDSLQLAGHWVHLPLGFRHPLKEITIRDEGARIWTWDFGLCLVWFVLFEHIYIATTAHYTSSQTPRFTHWWCWRFQKYCYRFCCVLFYYNDLLLSLIKPFLIEPYVCVRPSFCCFPLSQGS